MECLMDEAPANPTHKCASPARRTMLVMSTEECMARPTRIQRSENLESSNAMQRQDTRGSAKQSVLNLKTEESNT